LKNPFADRDQKGEEQKESGSYIYFAGQEFLVEYLEKRKAAAFPVPWKRERQSFKSSITENVYFGKTSPFSRKKRRAKKRGTAAKICPWYRGGSSEPLGKENRLWAKRGGKKSSKK